jgi:hypothetical protein
MTGSVAGTVVVAAAAGVGCFDEAAGVAVLDFAGGLEGLLAGAAVTLTEAAAAGRSVIAGLASALAVAVSVTDVPAAVPDGTVTCVCSWYEAGATEVASAPTEHEALPSPPGQLPVKAG